MLVLSRKKNESILIDNGKIKLTVLEVRGDKVRLGIVAPRDVSVHREEVHERIKNAKPHAEGGSPGSDGVPPGAAPNATQPEPQA